MGIFITTSKDVERSTYFSETSFSVLYQYGARHQLSLKERKKENLIQYFQSLESKLD